MGISIISNLFSAIQNAERARKNECITSSSSHLTQSILHILQLEGYIGEFEFIDDGRGGKFKIQLLGRINRCGSITPRFPIKIKDILNRAKQHLPARDVGIVIVSTPKGLKNHNECIQENIGGVLIGYVY